MRNAEDMEELDAYYRDEPDDSRQPDRPEREYREDDENVGYCPDCSEPLSAITVGARGVCEQHGWQYANWKPQT